MSPESKKHIRVLLIEDNLKDAELITKALEAADTQLAVERVETAEDLACALEEFKPDVVLSEHTLPRIGFRQALETIHMLRPQTPLIVVTGPLHTEDSGCCVRAGAETVILKTNIGRLAPAVTHAIAARAPLASLTSRQVEVMRLVANGYRTREIAEHLNLSEKTVESHRTQVMRRLGTPNTASLTRYAVRVGLALAGADIAVPASPRRASTSLASTRPRTGRIDFRGACSRRRAMWAAWKTKGGVSARMAAAFGPTSSSPRCTIEMECYGVSGKWFVT